MRVRVRCECGVERRAFVDDLRQERTRGCPSHKCQALFEAHMIALRILETALPKDVVELYERLLRRHREEMGRVRRRKGLDEGFGPQVRTLRERLAEDVEEMRQLFIPELEGVA